jgi:hypothetical protein
MLDNLIALTHHLYRAYLHSEMAQGHLVRAAGILRELFRTVEQLEEQEL